MKRSGVGGEVRWRGVDRRSRRRALLGSKSRKEKARGGSWRRGGADALLGRGPGAAERLNPGGADLCAAEQGERALLGFWGGGGGGMRRRRGCGAN